jgi:hypothetical protein
MGPQVSKTIFFFSVLGHSQESEPVELDEEAEGGIDSDASELQPSFDQPSELFQTAAKDPMQAHSAFSAPPISQEVACSLLESSSS